MLSHDEALSVARIGVANVSLVTPNLDIQRHDRPQDAGETRLFSVFRLVDEKL